jgi:hypothetical protein
MHGVKLSKHENPKAPPEVMNLGIKWPNCNCCFFPSPIYTRRKREHQPDWYGFALFLHNTFFSLTLHLEIENEEESLTLSFTQNTAPGNQENDYAFIFIFLQTPT